MRSIGSWSSSLITYECDGDKAISNERKHGIGFVEAISVFDDPLGLSVPDDEHSVDEIIRIISARQATKHECRSCTEGQT